MKVLFIGGTGLISTACSRLALERGIELYLLNRGRTAAAAHPPQGARVIAADVRQPQQAAAALGGRTFDAVVDFIAYTPEHVKTDLQLFAGRVGQYVLISSASAYQKPVSNYLITESTPLVNPYWEYSRLKIACEERLTRAVRDEAFPGVIVRPSYTYGPEKPPGTVNSATHPWTLADRMLKGRPVVVHGEGTSLWPATHNSDFAKGLVGLLGNPAASGHAFHVTTDEAPTWDQIYLALGRALGVEPKIVHVPTDFLVRLDPSQEGTLRGDKAWSVVFDNTKIKRFVPGFAATTTLAEGVRGCVAWHAADAARREVDEAHNRWTDEAIAAYARVLDASGG